MSYVFCLRHFGLVVQNMDLALKFYQDLLGLQPSAPAAEERGPFIDTILGQPGIEVTTLKMKASGETLLEFLHFKNPPTSGEGFPRKFYSQGPTHLAFTVTDLQGLVEKLLQAGAQVVSPACLAPNGQVWVAFAHDFEGNLVELVQPVAREN